MSDETVITDNTPHLVVTRWLDNGTDLCEFWVLESYCWNADNSPIDGPALTCYVANHTGTRDVETDGLPFPDDRAAGSCNWYDAPEEVREQFREQVEQMQALMDEQEWDDDDSSESRSNETIKCQRCQ